MKRALTARAGSEAPLGTALFERKGLMDKPVQRTVLLGRAHNVIDARHPVRGMHVRPRLAIPRALAARIHRYGFLYTKNGAQEQVEVRGTVSSKNMIQEKVHIVKY
jgi:hypothetical protein